MNTQITLDKAGRIVLPKVLRDALHLSPGDALDLSVEGEDVILHPRRNTTPLQKEQGVWVFRTGEPLTAAGTREALNRTRRQHAFPPGKDQK